MFAALCAETEPGAAERQIEAICDVVRREFARQDLSANGSDFLLDHAQTIQESIAAPELRSMHLMVG